MIFFFFFLVSNSNSFKLEHYLLGLWIHNAEIFNLKEADLLCHKNLFLDLDHKLQKKNI